MKYFFECWDELKENLTNKFLMLFLDYDGTLAPIADSPDKAVISVKNKELLERLSKEPNCKLAIISGRSLKDIKSMVGIKNIIYSGNHGLEISGPKIKFENPVSEKYRVTLEQIKSDLSRALSSIKGVFIEDKGLSLSLHYRLVNKKQIPRLTAIVDKTILLYLAKKKIKVKSGKMVIEIRPPLEWDKGKIALWLLARQKFLLTEKPFTPIYIGDDKTDEDAFSALKNKGITVFVGEPKPSYAQYYLKNTQEVSEFLKLILDLPRTPKSPAFQSGGRGLQKNTELCQN